MGTVFEKRIQIGCHHLVDMFESASRGVTEFMTELSALCWCCSCCCCAFVTGLNEIFKGYQFLNSLLLIVIVSLSPVTAMTHLDINIAKHVQYRHLIMSPTHKQHGYN